MKVNLQLNYMFFRQSTDNIETKTGAYSVSRVNGPGFDLRDTVCLFHQDHFFSQGA